MNTSFMRLLAERLEHLYWIEVIPQECHILEFFDCMDEFFMSSDLKFCNRPPGFIFGDEDYFIGSIEDWAVELIQEQRGYYDNYDHEEDRALHWHDAQIDDEFSEREVWLLACRAMGLGEKAEGGEFVVDEELVNALLRPSALYGRMRGVTPKMAAEVLRLCAGGTPPQDAWALLGQALREIRLMELASVVEKAPHGLPVEKVAEWSHEDLVNKLTHFSMLRHYEPWVTAQGDWCGDLSLWAYRLYGATAELSFGPDARGSGPVASSAFLGLGLMEGVALFEALVSPDVPGEPDFDTLRGALTPEVASQVLRRVAGGVFPAVAWQADYDRLGLDALLDGTGSSQDRR